MQCITLLEDSLAAAELSFCIFFWKGFCPGGPATGSEGVSSVRDQFGGPAYQTTSR